MKQNKNIFLGALASIVILGGIIWLGNNFSALSPKNTPLKGPKGALSAKELNFDFGEVSMAKGKVSHLFKIENAGADAALINSIYTSCMCTAAILDIKGEKWGPFGMPGHGFTPNLNIAISPGEEAGVEAIFDPAAHGPAGVGKVERSIIIKTAFGEALELKFGALVTP